VLHLHHAGRAGLADHGGALWVVVDVSGGNGRDQDSSMGERSGGDGDRRAILEKYSRTGVK
jgi:hypothetical protein